MCDENKKNIQFFSAKSMAGLFSEMESWQRKNKKRFLSASVQRDGDQFCCIALTNPSEVVITSADGQHHATVTSRGQLVTV